MAFARRASRRELALTFQPHDERLATDLADTLLSIAAARTDVSEPRARLALA